MSESLKPAPDRPPASETFPAPELEFPDWSGQRRGPTTVSMDDMLRYSESMLPHLRSLPGWRERRLAGHCHVEFNL